MVNFCEIGKLMKVTTMVNLPDEQASERIAARLAVCLSSPLVLTFSGEIGAGKTTLIRAMLRSLGVRTAIKSPTFSLIESYQTNQMHIHHFDLYRIQDETELDYIGFRDYFESDAVCCIEWPERAPGYLSDTDVNFTLGLKGAGREMQINAFTSAGAAVMSCLEGE